MGVETFKEQKRHPLMKVHRSHLTKEELKELKKIEDIPITDYKDILDIDDTDKYNWVQIGTEKYGRSMYCTKTKIRRTQTMGEFYGAGVVD